MNDSEAFRCARCDAGEAAPLGRAPFPNEIGRRVAEEICPSCWDDWKDRQMLLINHYGIDLQDREARSFLMDEMETFLFEGGGDEDDIDTSQQGKIDWS